MPAVVDAIREDGFAEVPFGIDQAGMDELFGQYDDFICLVKDEPALRAPLTVATAGAEDFSMAYFEDVYPGYIKPSEPSRGPTTDDKTTLHYSELTRANVARELGTATPAEMKAFLDNCEDVYQQGIKSLRVGANALHLSNVVLDPKNPYNQNVLLRLLSYRPVADESRADGLAGLHFDRSALTVTLAEDKPGLCGAPGQNGYLEPVDPEYLDLLAGEALAGDITHRSGTAKFFLGAGFNHLPESLRTWHGDLDILAHAVKNTANLRRGTADRRHAAIIFANPRTDLLDTLDYNVPEKWECGFELAYDRAVRFSAYGSGGFTVSQAEVA